MSSVLSRISVDYEQPEVAPSGESGVCSTRHAWARVTSRSTAGLSKERKSNSGSYARFS